MVECGEDPSSLPYGMVITYLLEAFNIPLSSYSYVSTSKCYNNRVFVTMGYVSADGICIKKQEVEAKVTPFSSKVKVDTS